VPETDYRDVRLGDFLEGLTGGAPGPGGASAAAMTAAFAASLVTMVARKSADSWAEAAGAAAQARGLEARVIPLATATAAAWEAALEALGGAQDGAPTERNAQLEEKLARSAEIPLAIAEAAADIARLAAVVAELGEGTYRSDAAAAAVLAAGAARASAHFVAINLGTRPDDEWLQRAVSSSDAAADAASRALDAGP
jgi:formiminotetrahydrofolate cyclodeaminase